MKSQDGLQHGNFVSFLIEKFPQGPSSLMIPLKVDSGSDRDLLLPLEVGETLDLGELQPIGFVARGVSGQKMGVALFPAQVMHFLKLACCSLSTFISNLMRIFLIRSRFRSRFPAAVSVLRCCRLLLYMLRAKPSAAAMVAACVHVSSQTKSPCFQIEH